MATNECKRLADVCLFEGDSLPLQYVTFTDDAAAAVDISTAVCTITFTAAGASTAVLSYTLAGDTEVTVTGAGSNVLNLAVGATDMEGMVPGTYTILWDVALSTAWTRSAVQRLDITARVF
jgi:hypothetical protein